MKNVLTIALISCIIAGCSPLSKFIPSPGVNANVQAGKENTQQVVGNQETIEAEAVEISKVQGSQVEIREIAGSLNQTINTIPPWVLLLLIIGWLLPSPSAIWDNLVELIHGKKNNRRSY